MTKSKVLTPTKSIKEYADVQVGDVAYENPDAGGMWNNEEGIILWKGTKKDLDKSQYAHTASDWEEVLEEEEEFNDYDLVVVEGPYGPTLFNYNNDPSGVVVFK